MAAQTLGEKQSSFLPKRLTPTVNRAGGKVRTERGSQTGRAPILRPVPILHLVPGLLPALALSADFIPLCRIPSVPLARSTTRRFAVR